jgi:hypothetical protein
MESGLCLRPCVTATQAGHKCLQGGLGSHDAPVSTAGPPGSTCGLFHPGCWMVPGLIYRLPKRGYREFFMQKDSVGPPGAFHLGESPTLGLLCSWAPTQLPEAATFVYLSGPFQVPVLLLLAIQWGQFLPSPAPLTHLKVTCPFPDLLQRSP